MSTPLVIVITVFVLSLLVGFEVIAPAKTGTGSTTAGAVNRLLRLDVGGTTILSRVTWRSVERLQLRPGMRVFAQVKSVALA